MSCPYRFDLKNATVHQLRNVAVGDNILTGYQLTPTIGGHAHTLFFIDGVMPVQIAYYRDQPWLEQLTRMHVIERHFNANQGHCVPLFNSRFSDWDDARWREDTPVDFFEQQLALPSFGNIREWEVTPYHVYGVPYLVLAHKQQQYQCPFAVYDVECMQDIVSEYNASVIPPRRITSDTPGFHQILATIAP